MRPALHSWRALGRTAGLAAAAGLVVTVPWWGPRTLAAWSFFRVRSVEVEGLRYVAAGDVVDRLHVDTTVSVWNDPRPLEARLRGLVKVRAARVSRKLPGTLVVRVAERMPVALVPGAGGMRVYDGTAIALPIDPTRFDLDLPIVARVDGPILRLLDAVRTQAPALYARISDVRRQTSGDLVLTVSGAPVRAPSGVEAGRLAELLPVLADLARRRASVAELDLRYRDQVIARLR